MSDFITIVASCEHAEAKEFVEVWESEILVVVNAVETGMKARRIPVIGIVGGIGSGKSAIAKWVAAHGNIEVLDADVLGHEALQDSKVKEALLKRFGQGIFGSNGEIDRSALAVQVFGSDSSHREARRDLELVVHPEIGRRISQRIELATAHGRQAVLLDAAVLLEAGWKSHCDKVIFIDTPDEIRLGRVRDHRGWTEEALKRRESSQWTLAVKRREADLIVTNTGELEQAGTELLDFLQQQGLIFKNSHL